MHLYEGSVSCALHFLSEYLTSEYCRFIDDGTVVNSAGCIEHRLLIQRGGEEVKQRDHPHSWTTHTHTCAITEPVLAVVFGRQIHPDSDHKQQLTVARCFKQYTAYTHIHVVQRCTHHRLPNQAMAAVDTLALYCWLEQSSPDVDANWCLCGAI